MTIGPKLALTFAIGLAIPAIALGITLSLSYSDNARTSARDTLKSVSLNAENALINSLQSADTSMKLLANQIGYNSDFANSILTASSDATAYTRLQTALQGENKLGDGSTIIGALDYLTYSDPDIKEATMYTPFVDNPVLNRLNPMRTASNHFFTEERYNRLLANSGSTIWFFGEGYTKPNLAVVEPSLYAWRALVNFGVDDMYDMQVVGYIEYRFDQDSFLSCITDTKYDTEGMFLYDETGKRILNVASGKEKADALASEECATAEVGDHFGSDYSAVVSTINPQGWKYVTYINHSSIEAAQARNRWVTIGIVSLSVIVGIGLALTLSRSTVRRLRDLSKAAGSIAGGEYDTEVEKKSNDEITDVGESFNIMADKVRATLQAMVEQQDAISENFATILEAKSGESGHHVKRVSEYSGILATQMGFSPNEVHDIKIASMLHDVGKIMVPNEILEKPGRLDDEEFKIMQQHVAYGDLLLRDVPGNIMQLGAIIAGNHHERWDGKGYVNHRKGDEIPRVAQLVSVADVFDALTSRRSYKKPWTMDDAYNEIVKCRGAQFSPEAVDAFIATFDQFKVIAELYKDEAESDGHETAANA